MAIDWSLMVAAETRRGQAMEAARVAASARLVAQIDALAAGITGRVPEAEVASWDGKVEAARAVLEAPVGSPEQAAGLALIAAEAEVTGETAAALATRVLAKAHAYRMLMARLTGERRRAAAAIAAATTAGEVEQALADALAACDAAVAEITG